MPIQSTPSQLRALSDVQLSEHLAGWRPGTGEWNLANMELTRRQNAGNVLRGWIAVCISVVALIISALSLVKAWH